jgi:hypothetical protein
MFTIYKQTLFMNSLEEELSDLKQTLDAQYGWHTKFTEVDSLKNCGKIEIWPFDNHKAVDLRFFFLKWKKSFDTLFGMHAVAENSLFIAPALQDSLKEKLRENGMSYMELNGNTFICQPPVLLFTEGNKKPKKSITVKNRAFSKTGLKIIFAYLTDTTSIYNQPVRVAAGNLEISYTNFHYVNQGLKELGYLVPKNENTFILHNRQDLLQRWITHYEERLKPGLLIGRFRFLAPGDYKKWESLVFENDTEWGGEPAAALLTGQLSPEIFTIYSNETKADLVKKYKIIPDEKGDIYIYKNFYQFFFHPRNGFFAHPVLIYADLMISGDNRNTSIAEKIYEQYIQY